MKLKKYFFIVFVMIFGIFLFSNKSFAGTQRWNSLDYNVKVNSDGSMDVVETWDIYISETNTLFKDFNIDKSKYSGITNVEVIQKEPVMKNLRQIYEEQYHVDSGCYYALPISGKKFEIAWNVGLDNSSDNRVYEVRYRINDAVKIYNDCTELYWQFLDKTNAISGRNVTGTIKLPKSVKNEESLRIWGHGDLGAEIHKEGKNSVIFEAKTLPKNTMLEIRIVTEENIYESCINKVNKNKLDNILKEEQKWADQANRRRNRIKIIIICAVIIYIALFIYFFSKIVKYIKHGSELKLKYNTNNEELKYFRDIPDEKNASPAKASYFYYFKKNSSNSKANISKIFSATMLDLALKKFIEIEPIDQKNMKIIVKKDKDTSELVKDEKVVYDLISRASGDSAEITTKDFAKYGKIHYDSVYMEMNSITNNAERDIRDSGKIDQEKEKICQSYKNKFIIYLVVIFLSLSMFPIFMIGIPIMIEFIICAILCVKNSNKFSILSDQGIEEEKQWKALKNYMDDFSLLKEKEVPDLILWEKFLVYATAFGISKKVLKQLKVVYPELNNPDFYNNRNYNYLYFVADSRFGDDFISSFDNMASSVYHSAASAYSSAHSSGSGGGGGFSGGGGGRRRRRPVAVEDKK